MKIIKKIIKIILIVIAVALIFSGACFRKESTIQIALAEESTIAEESAPNQAYNRYCAFTIPAKSELNFISSNTNTKINGNTLSYLRLNLSYGNDNATYLNFNLIYPVILSFTINYNSPNYAKVVETTNGFYFDEDLTIYLPINYVDGYNLNEYSTVYINSSVLIYADTRNYTYELTEDLKLSNNYIDNYNTGYEDGYIVGEQYGYEDGYIAGAQNGYSDGYTEGEQIGYSAGYTEGEQIGYEKGEQIGYNNGFQDAVNGGYNEQGIFSGAIAFMRTLFTLFTSLFETPFAGEISVGFVFIGLPATFMIIDLVISLVRKFMGKNGGGE